MVTGQTTSLEASLDVINSDLMLRRFTTSSTASLQALSDILPLNNPLIHWCIQRSFASTALNYDIETIIAQRRDVTTKSAVRQLRKKGKLPGTLQSLPGNTSLDLIFSTKQIAAEWRKHGRSGWACRLYNIAIVDDLDAALAAAQSLPPSSASSSLEPSQAQQTGIIETYRALGRLIHMTSSTGELENATLLYTPPERRVKVNVPLKIWGKEVCPGLKAGGHINYMKRAVPCICPGDNVPTSFEVDIRNWQVGDKLYPEALMEGGSVPHGVVVKLKDGNYPLLNIKKG